MTGRRDDDPSGPDDVRLLPKSQRRREPTFSDSRRGTLSHVLWPIKFVRHLVVSACFVTLDALLFAPLKFFRRWIDTRYWPSTLWGLPPLMLAVVATLFVYDCQQVPKHEIIVAYQQAVTESEQLGETRAADLWRRKLEPLIEQTPETRYAQALVAEQQGNQEQARKIMHTLAPDNAEGYLEAHVWIFRDLIAQGRPLTEELRETLEHHVNQALKLESAAPSAHAVLGQLWLLQQDVEQAVTHFEAAASDMPELNLTLAELYRVVNRPEKSREAAQQAIKRFRTQAEEVPDEWSNRLKWCRSEMAARNFEQAVQIIEQRPKGIVDADAADAAMVDLYLAWTEHVRWIDADNLDRQLELLKLALRHGPDHPQAQTRVAELATQKWKRAQEALQTLKAVMDSSSVPDPVHFILGTRALEEGDTEGALAHLEQALQHNPDSAILLNNLAWALAHQDNPDLDRALYLVETAIRIGDQPNMRGTRADILERQGEFQGAIVELEAVLSRHKNPAWVHERLARLYDRIDDSELADLHRGMLEKHQNTAPETPSGGE